MFLSTLMRPECEIKELSKSKDYISFVKNVFTLDGVPLDQYFIKDDVQGYSLYDFLDKVNKDE